MTERIPAGVTAASLLVALEPTAPRRRVESALVLLGFHAASVDEALQAGLLRTSGEALDTVDPRLPRRLVQQVAERDRRSAHLALACAHLPAVTGYGARATFDRLSALLNDPRLPHQTDRLERLDHSDNRLTAQETHVARLAATGVPNREIARAAFLSPKTVEYHLTRIYRKLGVRSKAELACIFRFG